MIYIEITAFAMRDGLWLPANTMPVSPWRMCRKAVTKRRRGKL